MSPTTLRPAPTTRASCCPITTWAWAPSTTTAARAWLIERATLRASVTTRRRSSQQFLQRLDRIRFEPSVASLHRKHDRPVELRHVGRAQATGLALSQQEAHDWRTMTDLILQWRGIAMHVDHGR